MTQGTAMLEVEEARELLCPAPHPMLPVPGPAEIEQALQTTEGAAAYARWLTDHRRQLRLAEEDPLWHGFEPPVWRLVDEALIEYDTVAVFGGNRTSKSYLSAKRFCESAMTYPDGVQVGLAEKDETSIATQQKLVWHFLRPHLQHLNGKKNPTHKINYSQANGFTEGKIVLPNRTEIYFLTYKQVAHDYEGWEFGARVKAPALTPTGRVIHNLGWWADESLTLGWLEVLTRRTPFRKAHGIWAFTPVRGITPAVKEFIGSTGRVLSSAPAELLPDSNVPGCPRGEMPLVIEPFWKKSRAIYFHVGANPFGDYTTEIKRLCEGKSTEYVERVAYGYARDSVLRAFSNFGSWNVVDPDQLPATGTNYMVTDPADVRPFFTIWIRVTPGDPPDLYIYRDWPDEQTFGEWATPTERETSEESRRGWDGDPGPAQGNPGLGITGYKKVWCDAETVLPDGPPERDPFRAALQVHARALREPVREPIFERLIDSRAAPREHVAEQGGTCLLWEFEKNHSPEAGASPEGEPVYFRLASGEIIDRGITMIKDLLEWDREKPLCPGVNAPHLFVSSECRQVIWALSHYTGRAGETGACKDVIDCVRYAANGQLQHMTTSMFRSEGGGSY